MVPGWGAWNSIKEANRWDLGKSLHSALLFKRFHLCAGLLGLRTLVFKMIGVVCSMAGGLIAGKEGPFIHAGNALLPL